jgi:hypothetical protein
MNWYMVFLKIDPNHTDKVIHKLQTLKKNPLPNITLNSTYNVFGTWDSCLWFQANTHDQAMTFVQKYIRPIQGVTETYTVPTSIIKQYK